MRVSEGQLSLIDLVNRAYIHSLNNKVWVVSGVGYMPIINEDSKMVMKLISLTGSTLFPLCLSLLLPIFMYTLVHEKEEKLIIMMRMNGLKMSQYWIVSYLFSVSISLSIFAVFYFFGYYFLDIYFFT